MGNNLSVRSNLSVQKCETRGRVLFLLHRTWTVIVTRSRTGKASANRSESGEELTSTCSCSECRTNDDDGGDDLDKCDSSDSSCSGPFIRRTTANVQEAAEERRRSGRGRVTMAPNSEERRRLDVINWNDDTLAKEKQRPPIYNPEDYALSLRKWGRRPPSSTSTAQTNLYMMPSHSDTDLSRNNHRANCNTLRDYINPLSPHGSEMTLKQFGTVTELLNKLRADLKLAYPSFVQEFVGDPFDGIALLLDLLRAIQLSQVNNTHYVPGSSATTGKVPLSVQRRALLDELACLQCLFCACLRYSESITKLTASSAGLFTLAVCIMSNVNKSRIIALQLLAKACESSGSGHSAVSEALSTLRLRFGEPVRFRFLVGMLSSASGQGELLATGLKFVNSFLKSTSSLQKRLYVQAELEQAGFDIKSIKQNIPPNTPSAELVYEEIEELERNHIDVESLMHRVDEYKKENRTLRDEVQMLERRVNILQEEKGILVSLEQCLKDRCNELQDEVLSLKSTKSLKMSNISSQKHSSSTPAEDEGISSSERSITPEDDAQQESSVYEIYKLNSDTISLKTNNNNNKTDAHVDAAAHGHRRRRQSVLLDDEEEATIEEVMAELNNIINKAETEEYNKDVERKRRIEMEKARAKNKIQMRVSSNVSVNDHAETEIVPSNLHPQPPRKTRSLVHLFVPPDDDYEYANKEMFFENETMYTSEEGSDSLLSASKCAAREKAKKSPVNDIRITVKHSDKPPKTPSSSSPFPTVGGTFKRNPSRISTAKRPDKTYKQHDYQQQKMKSKSLDRIDDGLSTLIDIVVTDRGDADDRVRSQSDSGKLTHANNVQQGKSTKLSQIFANQSIEEKHRIFLPIINRYEDKDAYYFPRVQEKRCATACGSSSGNNGGSHFNGNSFHVRKGHNNAGLYSGHAASSEVNCKKNEFVSMCSKTSSSKISDYPSGLY